MIEKLKSHYGFTKTPFGRALAPQMLHRHGTHAEAVARIGWWGAGAGPPSNWRPRPSQHCFGVPHSSTPMTARANSSVEAACVSQ